MEWLLYVSHQRRGWNVPHLMLGEARPDTASGGLVPPELSWLVGYCLPWSATAADGFDLVGRVPRE